MARDSETTKAQSTSTSSTEAPKESEAYFGTVPDPTPNENYTVAGVTSGAPTPETDAKLRQQAREANGLA